MKIKKLANTFFLQNNTLKKKNMLQQSNKKKSARGSALILALFIIIVLTFLGVALMRVLSTSSESIAQEVIGTRALMAANSGMQAHLQQLFPLNTTSSLASCPADQDYNLLESGTDIPGLYHCKAITSCDEYFTDPGPDPLITTDDIKYFRLTSIGECGTGNIKVAGSNAVISSRTIQVEARSL
jgi:MSHA biogenesis protein MshP